MSLLKQPPELWRSAEVYAMRERALEGRVFYENKNAEKEHVKTYFPQYPSENANNYKRRPKISIPITSEVIGRVVNATDVGFVFEFLKGKEYPDEYATFTSHFDPRQPWDLWRKNLIGWTLAEGNFLVVIRTRDINDTRDEFGLELFPGEYCFKTKEGYPGYEFYEDKDAGKIVPILATPTEEQLKTFKRVTFTDTEVITFTPDKGETRESHYMGFVPAEWFYSLDMAPRDVYARPYPETWWPLVTEYNQVFSQCSKAIKVLQNVWVTNQEPNAPSDSPLIIAPEVINFLGEDGKLQQAARELDLVPEGDQMARINVHIANTAHVPPFFTGLEKVGTIPSGIALQIYFQPLAVLTNNILLAFLPRLRSLIIKSLKAIGYINRETIDPDGLVSVSESFLPIDVERELSNAEKAESHGWIDNNEARGIARKALGLPVDEDQEQK